MTDKINSKTNNDNNETNSGSSAFVGFSEEDIVKQDPQSFSTGVPAFNYKKIQEDINRLNKKIEDFSKNEEQYSTIIDNLKKEQAELKKNYDEALNDSQKKIIETMGVFVALFTFISISTTTLLNFQNIYNSLFFLSAFTLILTSFLGVFHFILTKELKFKDLSIILVIPFFCTICFGIICFFKDPKEIKEQVDNQKIYQTNDIKMNTIISTNTVTISTNVHTYKNS